MPLLDHFHPPLSAARHWEGFHGLWAGSMVSALNDQLLPPGYFAEAQIHVGSRVEVDVATFDSHAPQSASADGGGVATVAAPVWAPPIPAQVMPAIFPDSLEVLVFNS